MKRRIYCSARLRRAEVEYSQAESDMRWSGFQARGGRGYTGVEVACGTVSGLPADMDDRGRSARLDAAMMADAQPEAVARWRAARAEVDRLSALPSHARYAPIAEVSPC